MKRHPGTFSGVRNAVTVVVLVGVYFIIDEHADTTGNRQTTRGWGKISKCICSVQLLVVGANGPDQAVWMRDWWTASSQWRFSLRRWPSPPVVVQPEGVQRERILCKPLTATHPVLKERAAIAVDEYQRR